MNDTHDECRQLITDLVTGDGAQLENLSMDNAYWREMASTPPQGEDGNLHITVSIETWLAMLDVARNHTETYPEEDEDKED